jgi:hypothetical protein
VYRAGQGAHCSGVALAPNLVATGLSCVTPSQDVTFDCDDESWLPVESGNFGAWFEVADPELITVQSTTLVGEQLQFGNAVGVRKILSSGSVSGCADDLAILVLADSVTESRAAVRLVDAYRAEEAVVVRGVSSYASKVLEATVSAVTGSIGSDISPPRGLVIDVGTCADDRGGAVISAETGALIGLVQWSTEDCAGQTIALQLAPFRRLLIEAAGAAGATLEAEWDPTAAEPGPAADSCVGE